MTRKFHISTHGRLQDWIAVEKGYFRDQGLDFQIDVRLLENADQDITPTDGADVHVGAYELYQAGGGGKKNMSCACHWAVNQAATDDAGRMWGHAYSVLPSGVFVRGDSPIERPQDLAGQEVAVGYHSGSHFSTIQALEPFCDRDQIKLKFVGMPYDRVDALLEGAVPAAAAWNAAAYVLEQLGCRRIVDSTFMAGFMFGADTDPGDVKRYFESLRLAQIELDLAPERYKHYYSKEMPARFAERVDVTRFGPGERIVFLPYTPETYERTQLWMEERGLFDKSESTGSYDTVVQV